MKQSILKLLQYLALTVAVSAAGYAQAAEHEAVLDWAAIFEVNFPLDGRVASVHVRAGDRISKGTRLVELDAEPIAIRVSQYEAEVAANKPVLADAKRDYEHAQSLYEQTVLSDVELQRARHANERASAELRASQARLRYAQWQMEQASMAAPWDAWVVERDVEPGQMLVAEQRSRALLVLAKTGVMTATAWMPLAAIQSLNTGQPATVVIGNKQFAATVRSFGMREQTGRKGERYLEVEFETGAEHIYRAGQAATIRLP